MALRRKKNGKNWYWQFKYIDEFGNRKTKMVNTGVSSLLESEKAKNKARVNGEKLQIVFLDEYESTIRIKRKGKQISHNQDTIKEYADFWLEELKGSVADNTLYSYQGPLEYHILPRIGHIKLKELTQFDLKEFIEKEISDCEEKQEKINQRKEKAKGKPIKILNSERPYFNSIKKHLDIIKMMLEYAVCEGDIEMNPAKKINKQFLKKIPKSEYESQPFNKEEIMKLREGIKGHHLEPVIILASYLGLRRSEVLGLRWKDIDFENDEIMIRNVCVIVGTEIVYREKTKTKESRAVLPMVFELKEYLLELKMEQEKNKKNYGTKYYDSDLVCCRSNGRPIKPNNVSQAYKKLLENIGLRPTRFHDLRKSVGSIILESTHDLKLTQQVLRHSTIDTTANIYVKHSKKQLEKGMKQLEDLEEE